MERITVITPTIRPDGLEIVETALKRQTNQNFEWLVGSSFRPQVGACKWVKDDFKGGAWTLNRIYNKLVRESQGDIIVSIQDFTFFDATALERFGTQLRLLTGAVLSGVGDKYEEVYPYPSGKFWRDPRDSGTGNIREAGFFGDIEFNFCALPKGFFYDVGGFDESLDFLGYGMDGYSVMERLYLKGGYKFYIDEGIKSYSLAHGRAKDWEEKNLIHSGYKLKAKEYEDSPVLQYL